MLSATPASNGSCKASTKRSLFAKPSWSKTQDLGNSDLFHRSDQMYMASAADAERKKKGKLAKKEKETEKERVQQNKGEERASKRQNMSEDDEDDVDKDYEEEEGDDGDDEDNDNEPRKDMSALHFLGDNPTNNLLKGDVDLPRAPYSPLKSISSLVDNYQMKLAQRATKLEEQRPKVPNVINLDDDESFANAREVSLVKIVEAKKEPILEEEGEFITSGEEFPELARKARERARRKRLEQDVASQTPDLPSSVEAETTCISPPSTIPSPPEALLQILITSSIPDTVPLIVSRKLGQRLKDVRLAWMNKQKLLGAFVDNVFLTWRGKRLFDVTTCKSLGVIVDTDGRVMAKGDILGDDEGRIHMEAMTPEILEARRRAKTQEATNEEDNESGHETQRPVEDDAENQVRIILKARGFAEFRLKVKPTTLISKILSAFRHTNQIDPEKEVYIMFEGERLEPTTAIVDSEIADLDSLDTYVK